MDEKEFLKRLSEVAEWHRPQTGPNGSPSISKGKEKKMPPHPGPITEAELDEMSEHEVKVYYDKLIAWRESQPNESVPPEILRIKVQSKNCEDCGRLCPEGRRVECKQHSTGRTHWREYCTTCELYKDPATGKFTLPKLGSHQHFISFYRPKLGLYKSKYQQDVVKEKIAKAEKIKPKNKQKITKEEIIKRIITEGHWETKETEDSITRIFVPKLPGV